MAVVLAAVDATAMGRQRSVAGANIARLLAPAGLPADASRTFDADHLIGLGGGAIVELVDAFPRLPISQRLYVDILLRIELSRRDEDRTPDRPGWRLQRGCARAALRRDADAPLRYAL